MICWKELKNRRSILSPLKNDIKIALVSVLFTSFFSSFFIHFANAQTDLEKELELARERIASVQANPNINSVSYAVVYVTSEPRCDDTGYKRLEFYESVIDQYLTKYGIPHHEKQSSCINQSEYNSYLSQLSTYDLPILILDQKVGYQTLVIQKNAWGIYQWQSNGHQLISFCACDNLVESNGTAITLSHELSHFVLHYLGYPQIIFTGWVHYKQSMINYCFINSTLNQCTSDWTTVKSPWGKQVIVMSIYNPSDKSLEQQLFTAEARIAMVKGEVDPFSEPSIPEFPLALPVFLISLSLIVLISSRSRF